MVQKKEIKVLIIEDNKGDFRLMEEYLAEASGRGRNFEVAGAGSLAQAQDLLGKNRYDIILSDLFLPDSFGLDTFNAVFRRAADTPVVLLTGLEDEALGREAVRLGAQDYLVKKTVNGEILSRVIRYSMERQSVDASLRASEERYRTMIDALDDCIVVLDREYRIVMSNVEFKKAAACGAAGPAETGGKPAEGITALPPKSLQLCGRAFSEGRTIISEEPCVWNGRQSVLEMKCVPVPGGGRAQRVVIVARDITERKQVEQIKDDFASLVSHELRSPLTAILAGLGMVLGDGAEHLEEMDKQLLAVSYNDAQRLDRIITKLLEMSRLEAGTARFKCAKTDLVKLAGDVIAGFSSKAGSRGIELAGRYSAGCIETMLDSDAITEVFTNLISNALKFTEKGRVEIGVTEKEESIECYVKDSGIGISKENQAKLFAKFKQFGKPVSGEDKGTGLGLFIVKEILRRHSGTLSVASEPGKGTTFSFVLPKVREEQPAEPPEIPAAPRRA